jgi:pullulanase
MAKGQIIKTVHANEFSRYLASLDKFYSTKKLGSFTQDGKTIFRLFAPTAKKVTLVTFTSTDDEKGNNFEMSADKNGVWETILDGEKYGMLYGYKVSHSDNKAFNDLPLCVDPYARAVASFNTYFNPRRSIVVKENDYDWEGDKWIGRDWRDLIIYEMHIRNMTRDSSSEVSEPGTYKGLIEKGKKGGISYIKSLGVNTVEIMPTQEFGNIEAPFNKSLNGKNNTWNPYEINYWGYMTGAFFAPDAYYSETADHIEWNKWSGESAKQIKDFKDVVKAFHKEGIGVVMDVVYNHISEYEIGNLKEIDRNYYFRLDAKGNFISESYCGNDFKTERPMCRRMIVESILFWMKEYHVDGFRFDLGKLIDWKTVEEITREAHKINPHVIFVCEPWGGGYDPMGFSLRDWASWNDQIRNGIKGENPFNGHGWIFGNWYGNNNPDRIKSYVNGTLVKDMDGLFQKKEHSVNYLESHDGYTLGDFIRIATGIDPNNQVIDINKFVELSPLQLKLNKMGALFLLTSQGIIMISEGQEFARTKVIPIIKGIEDECAGKIDHNSYNKDNSTNYINYKHADMNGALLNYYKGLIQLRNKFSAFRRANYEEVSFYDMNNNPFALGYSVKHNGEQFVVLFNANRENSEEFSLAEGDWEILVNPEKAGVESLGKASEKITVESSSGFVLKKS